MYSTFEGDGTFDVSWGVRHDRRPVEHDFLAETLARQG